MNEETATTQDDANVLHPLGESHESKLLEDLRGLEPSSRNRGVVRVHLSRLQDENKQEDDLLSAETSFEDLTRTRRENKLQNCFFFR